MKRILLACLLATSSMSASALPVTYDLTFAAASGPSGSGALTWDSSTAVMTAFTWDFGAGLIGGIRNDVLLGAVFSSSTGAALWELITGEDVHPNIGPGNSLTLFTAFHGPAGSTYPEAMFFSSNGAYIFPGFPGQTESSGTISVNTPAVVPEPATLALFAIGALAAFTLRSSRRRRVR